MTHEKTSGEQEAASVALTVEEVMNRARTFVRNLLNGGAESPDIAFGLVYVASEFGLAVAEESIQVFPVVLSAVTSAVANHKSSTEGTGANNSDVSNSPDGKPNSATLH